VLAANHVSDVDALVLAAALPHALARRTWWSADHGRVFAHGWGQALARMIPMFPVDERSPAGSLEIAGKVLEKGEVLAWFPEEWRSADGALQPFRPGIGALVDRHRVTVVPVAIAGTFEAMPRTAALPKPHAVEVRFGAPIPADALIPVDAPDDDRKRHQAIADTLREKMAALQASG